MTAFSPPVPPAQSSTKVKNYRVLKSQFGNGYVTAAPDGINNIIDEWQLNFENYTQANRDTLAAFLDSVGTWGLFTWTAPGDSVSKSWMVQDNYSETVKAGSVYTINFKIKQVF